MVKMFPLNKYGRVNNTKSPTDGVENNGEMTLAKNKSAVDESWGNSTDEINWFSTLNQESGETASGKAPLVPKNQDGEKLQLIDNYCMSLDDLDFDEDVPGQLLPSAQASENQELTEPKRKRGANAFPSSLKLLKDFKNRFRRLKVDTPSSGDESRDTCHCKESLWIDEILRLAAQKFIELASHGDNELNDFNNLFPSSSWGLNEEDSKDLELLLYLLSTAEKIGQKKFESAKELLNTCDKLSSKNGTPVQRLVHYYSEALHDKVDWETGEMTLSESFGKKQVEYLKDEMKSSHESIIASYRDCPISQVIQFTSIQAVIEHVAEAKKIHIIDLEIRNGVQWTALLQALAARQAESCFENLTISALGINSKLTIEETGKRLKSFADSLNIPFSFKTMMVQDYLEVTEHTFEVNEDETVAVYSHYFFMGLILEQETLEYLTRVIRAINPRVMVSIEVQANLNNPVFVNRFIESLFFFGAFFDSLGCLKQEESLRTYIESQHLARGIKNIVVAEGNERMIRHVNINVWRAFFTRFGIEETELGNSSMLQANMVRDKHPCGKYCTLGRDGNSLIIGWKGTPLIAVTAWKFI